MKRRKAASIITAIIIMVMVFPMPLQAKTKTVTTYYVESEKAYYKNWDDNTKWYLSYSSKNNYKKGLWCGYESTNYKQDGTVSNSYKSVSTHDKKGRTKTSKSYENGKLTRVTKYTYKGNNSTSKMYDGNNKYIGKGVQTSSKTKYTSKSYDAKGKLTSEYVTHFNKKGTTKSTSKNYKDGKLTWKSESSYKNGKETKSTSVFYNNGKENGKDVSTYSYSGKYITENSVYTSGNYKSTTKSYYTLDKAGTRIYSWKKSYDSSGNLTSSYTYKYVKYTSGKVKGCVKQEIVLDNGEEYQKTEYTVKQVKRKVTQ